MVVWIKLGYNMCMASIDQTNNGQYRLSHFVITVTDSGIIASEYTYYEKEDIIKETTYPARIDASSQLLIIQMNYMHGKSISLSLNEFAGFFKNLPEWTMTRYYQLYDHSNNEKYISNINVSSKYSIKNFEILK